MAKFKMLVSIPATISGHTTIVANSKKEAVVKAKAKAEKIAFDFIPKKKSKTDWNYLVLD